ncbi:MAG: phosphopyruvate hydratase [bacterium]
MNQSQAQNKITKIIAEEIQDSHGNPTIKVTIWSGDISDSFSVPSGASTGAHEAHELRDEDGKGVKKAIENINKIIAPVLIGQDVLAQEEIDEIMIELDGTPNKDNLGGNSMIGVSVACAKVAARVSKMETFKYLQTLSAIKPSRPTPHLFMNLLEGGKHTKGKLAFQEYLLVSDTDNIREAVDFGVKVQNSLKEMIRKELGEESTVLGDEGGFATKINNIRKPLEFLVNAIKENNLEGKVRLSLDVAASSFYSNGMYKVDGKFVSKEGMLSIYDSLVKEFNLFSIEDPFDEEDFDSFKRLRSLIYCEAKEIFMVGDDLTVSNKMLLEKAIENGSVNAIIIKPNQIGTLSETLETMKLARENNIELIVSHRGEETNDDFIADLAYAYGCFGLKAGSPLKPERRLKYDRLIKISGM